MIAKSKTSAQPEPLSWKPLFITASTLFLARLVYLLFICPYGLGPDEAQYWHWSTHLDWSYATKPPLTTWLSWFSTQFLGQTEIALRLWALLGQAATLLVGTALAAHLAGPKHEKIAAWWAFALLAATPATGFASLILSPDALLVPLYLTALWLLAKQAGHAQKPRIWMFIGLLVGLAGLAKYSAVFFFPLAALFALLWQRYWLKTPWFYLAGLIALALQTPVIYWNAVHHFEGLAHVAWQANAGDSRHGGLLTLLGFIGGQFGIFGPIIFGLMGAAVTAAAGGLTRLPAAHRLMLIFILPLFIGFTLENFISKVQPNWPILATIPALVLLAAWLPGQSLFIRRVAIGGTILNAILTILLSHVLFFGFPNTLKPLREMLGMRELGNMTSLILSKMEPGTPIFASNYTTTARQAFYAKRGGQSMATQTYYLNPGSERLTQYDLWNEQWPLPDFKKKLVLFVAQGKDLSLPAAVAKKFKTCEYLTTAEIKHRNRTLQQARYYLCNGPK